MNVTDQALQAKLNNGHAALWEHDWDNAVRVYTEVLLSAPENPIAKASLGLAKFHQKKYIEALQLFQQLAAQYPEDPMPMERIARIYEREGLLAEASTSFFRAAELHLKAKDVEKSIADFQAVIRIEPNNQIARARLALIYERLGRKNEAAAEFLDLAAVIQQHGNIDKARLMLEYALKLKPDAVEVHNAMASLKKNEPLRLRDRSGEPTGAARMAQVREIETAVQEPEELTGNDPMTEARVMALKEMAGFLFEDQETNRPAVKPRDLQNFVPASSASEKVEAASHKRVLYHISECIDLQTKGENLEAAAELERAININLDLSAAHYLLGYLLRESDPGKSYPHLQKSVMDPAYALASNLIMGEIHFEAAQLKEASSNFLHALMLADAETVPPEEAGDLLQLYDPIFESLAFISHERDLRNLCAVIREQLSRPDWRDYLKAAREQLPPAPEGSPPLPLAEMLMDSTSSQVVESLAEVRQLAMQGKNRSAMEEAFRALSYAPSYLPLHIQIGEILVNEGRIQEAVEKFIQVARLYTVRGDAAQAIRLLTRVTRLVPMDISVRRNLIDLLRSNGRNAELIEQYMDLANVQYLLADLEQSRNAYHSALMLARQSRSTREQSIKILNRLADIEMQSLNYKEAVKAFEQLRSLSPLDRSTRVALVDLYQRLEMESAALNEVDAYIKLLEDENRLGDAENFLDAILSEKPDSDGLQRCMVSYYTSHKKTSTAIEKLDKLAEKLLVENNVKGSLAVVEKIISLNPPNQTEYERLRAELLKR